MPRTNVVGTTPPSGSGAQRCAQAGEREHRIDSTADTAATTAARSSPLLSASQSQRCIGFVCSLGVCATQREAAAAIMRGAPWQAGELDLQTAVDALQEAAAASELTAAVGQDAVQRILAGAFRQVSDDGGAT